MFTVIPSEKMMQAGAKVREFFCAFRAATYAAKVEGLINGR
jgi:hypothetical protein